MMQRDKHTGIRHGAAAQAREAMRARGWSEQRIQEWFAPLRGDGDG